MPAKAGIQGGGRFLDARLRGHDGIGHNRHGKGELPMTFTEVLKQARELLQSKGRVSYRALKLQFNLDDDYLAGLKDELIGAEHVAADEGGKVLVWTGASPVPDSKFQVSGSQSPAS